MSKLNRMKNCCWNLLLRNRQAPKTALQKYEYAGLKIESAGKKKFSSKRCSSSAAIIEESVIKTVSHDPKNVSGKNNALCANLVQKCPANNISDIKGRYFPTKVTFQSCTPDGVCSRTSLYSNSQRRKLSQKDILIDDRLTSTKQQFSSIDKIYEDSLQNDLVLDILDSPGVKCSCLNSIYNGILKRNPPKHIFDRQRRYFSVNTSFRNKEINQTTTEARERLAKKVISDTRRRNFSTYVNEIGPQFFGSFLNKNLLILRNCVLNPERRRFDSYGLDLTKENMAMVRRNFTTSMSRRTGDISNIGAVLHNTTDSSDSKHPKLKSSTRNSLQAGQNLKLGACPKSVLGTISRNFSQQTGQFGNWDSNMTTIRRYSEGAIKEGGGKFAEREKALEDQYFHRKNLEQLKKLKAELDKKKKEREKAIEDEIKKNENKT